MREVEERRLFGQRLRALREAAGLTQDELAARLEERGHKTTGSNVGAWERGQYAPRPPRVIVPMLEEILAAAGELAPMLGLDLSTPRLEDQLDDLLTRLERIERLLTESPSRDVPRRRPGESDGPR